jgi:hypothetical protein
MFCITVLNFMSTVGNILRSKPTGYKNTLLHKNNSSEMKDVSSVFLQPGSTEYERTQQFGESS